MDHFVVNVCEILDKRNFVAFMFEPPSENVKHYEGSSVADVEEVIHCRAARVETDMSGLDRNERLFFAGEVVE